MSERTAVYRLYDAEDTLLYVGVSYHFGTRWNQHAKVQPWWPVTDHQAVKWYASREDALLAEKIAIREEGPIHNIRDSPREKRVKDEPAGLTSHTEHSPHTGATTGTARSPANRASRPIAATGKTSAMRGRKPDGTRPGRHQPRRTAPAGS